MNDKPRQLKHIFFIILFVCTLATAICGQRGPLTLPEPAAASPVDDTSESEDSDEDTERE